MHLAIKWDSWALMAKPRRFYNKCKTHYFAMRFDGEKMKNCAKS